MPAAAKPIVVAIDTNESLYDLIDEIQVLNSSEPAKEGGMSKKAPAKQVVKSLLTALLKRASNDTLDALAAECASTDKKDKTQQFVESIRDARNKGLYERIPKSEEDQLAMVERVLKQNPNLKAKIKV
jgi:hypothetical protein